MRKSVGGFKDKIVSLFKTNTPKQAVYGRGKKQKQSEENIVNSIRYLFILKKIKKSKDRIIRDIKTLFEQEDDCYKPERVSNFWNNNYIENESNGDRNKNLSLK